MFVLFSVSLDEGKAGACGPVLLSGGSGRLTDLLCLSGHLYVLSPGGSTCQSALDQSPAPGAPSSRLLLLAEN